MRFCRASRPSSGTARKPGTEHPGNVGLPICDSSDPGDPGGIGDPGGDPGQSTVRRHRSVGAGLSRNFPDFGPISGLGRTHSPFFQILRLSLASRGPSSPAPTLPVKKTGMDIIGWFSPSPRLISAPKPPSRLVIYLPDFPGLFCQRGKNAPARRKPWQNQPLQAIPGDSPGFCRHQTFLSRQRQIKLREYSSFLCLTTSKAISAPE